MSAMEPEELTESEAATVRRIERAFAGVTLGGGTGWYEADSLDGGGAGMEGALARDERDDWHALLLNPEWRGSRQSELTFMDAEGLRFHLPPTMILSLQTLQTGGLEALMDTLTLLVPPGHCAYAGWMEKWSPLNDEQRACVAAFLRASAEAEEIHPLVSAEKGGWREAYESYWWRYDPDADRSVR